MTINSDITDSENDDSYGLPDLVMTDSARTLLKSIEDILAGLIGRTGLRAEDDEFYFTYRRFLDLYDRCMREIIDASGIRSVCEAGCSNCCCHWVDDVNSFEGAVISRYLADSHPEMIFPVIGSFRDDILVLESLSAVVDRKMDGCLSAGDDIPDPYDLLLSCYYQLERPCALLDGKGRCTVYPVRPLTCRDYLNIRDSTACRPDRINGEDAATLILYISDTVSERIETLHRRFDDGSGDMSLRSILLRFLESGKK